MRRKPWLLRLAPSAGVELVWGGGGAADGVVAGRLVEPPEDGSAGLLLCRLGAGFLAVCLAGAGDLSSPPEPSARIPATSRAAASSASGSRGETRRRRGGRTGCGRAGAARGSG